MKKEQFQPIRKSSVRLCWRYSVDPPLPRVGPPTIPPRSLAGGIFFWGATASPSIRQERALSTPTARTISGKRPLQSMPLRCTTPLPATPARDLGGLAAPPPEGVALVHHARSATVSFTAANRHDKKIGLCEPPHNGGGGDMRMQSRRSHAAEGDTMRKIVVLAAIAALIAAAVGIWSTATFDRPKVAGDVQATEAPSAPVSPHQIMVKQGRNLPVQYWADPF